MTDSAKRPTKTSPDSQTLRSPVSFLWGRMASCGRLGVGPVADAGPSKFLRCGGYSRFDRVHSDVACNALKLGRAADHSVIAFSLPKWFPGESQCPVSLPRCVPLQRLHQLRHRHARSDQQMYMIRHDDIFVEAIVPGLLAIANCAHHHRGHFRLAKVERARARGVEKAVHSDERCPRSERCRETAIYGKAAVQPPGEEDRMIERVVVGKSANVRSGHIVGVGFRSE